MPKILKRFLIVFVSVTAAMAAVVFSFSFLPRAVGGEETKALYKIKDIVHSRIEPQAGDLLDAARHFSGSGTCEYKNGVLTVLSYTKTGAAFPDAASAVPGLLEELRGCISQNELLSGENTEVEVCVENWSKWEIRIFPKRGKIIIALNGFIPLGEALDCCREFEEIDIGGYWGYSVTLPEDFGADSFSDFLKLRALTLASLSHGDAERASAALKALSGVDVTIKE